MTTEELKQDFESARIKHVHFKSKLRSYLFGNGGAEGPLARPGAVQPGPVDCRAACAGNGPYAHLPEARQFDQQHMLIHKEANRLMDMHRPVQAEEASSGHTTRCRSLPMRWSSLLQTMEAKLRTEA